MSGLRYCLGRRSGSSSGGTSSRHKIRIYDSNDDNSLRYSQMRDRERGHRVVGDSYYTSSTGNKSSRRSSSYRNDDRAFDMSALRGTLPSFYTTSHGDDYKSYGRSSQRRSVGSRSQYFSDRYDDYPTTSKSRRSKYDDDYDVYEIEEIDTYPTTSKLRRSKYDDDYNVYEVDGVDAYLARSKSRRSKYDDDDYEVEEVDDSKYRTVSTSKRRADPSWREVVSATDYDHSPVNITSSIGRRSSQSEHLRRTFEHGDVSGTVEAFMERDEDDEPEAVYGTFAFRRKRN